MQLLGGRMGVAEAVGRGTRVWVGVLVGMLVAVIVAVGVAGGEVGVPVERSDAAF